MSPEPASHEDAVDRADDELARAAKAHDPAGVAIAERKLDALASQEPAVSSRAADPFERELDEFAFKQSPLFVQQIESTQGSHVLFASVFREHFCLKSAEARLAAVRAVYRPIDARLRRAGVRDFSMLVVPLAETQANRSDALATATRGAVRLTPAGDRCS